MTNNEKNHVHLLEQLNFRELRVLEAIASQGESVTADWLEKNQIFPYQDPTQNKLLRKLCNLLQNPADFPFLLRQRTGENGKFIYWINPVISLNSINLAISKKMGLSEEDQLTQKNSQQQLILEKLEEVKTLVKNYLE